MKIYTISHTHLDLCDSPSAIRQPLYVGAYKCPPNARKNTWEYDDTCKNNISKFNSSFCELTGMRYIWATATDQIIGLEHYRRYLHLEGEKSPLTEKEIKSALKKYDCIVAKPVLCVNKFDARKCAVFQQYGFCHSENDLLLAQQVINETCNEKYRAALSNLLSGDSFHPCNILICDNRLFKAYCEWLFGILGKIQQQIDIYHGRDRYQARVFGFIAERLLDVWLNANDLTFCEYPLFDPINPEDHPEESYGHYKDRLVPSVKLNDNMYHGVNFNRVFNAQYYLENNNDLLEKIGSDASELFDHFINKGLEEGRLAHPHFSAQSYRNYHYRLREKLGNSLVDYCLDYLAKDCDEGSLGFQNTPLGYCKSPFEYVYDYAYYSKEYGEVLPANANNNTKEAFNHFITVGMKEGYQANAFFCPKDNLSYKELDQLQRGEAIDWEDVFNRYLNSIAT